MTFRILLVTLDGCTRLLDFVAEGPAPPPVIRVPCFRPVMVLGHVEESLAEAGLKAELGLKVREYESSHERFRAIGLSGEVWVYRERER